MKVHSNDELKRHMLILTEGEKGNVSLSYPGGGWSRGWLGFVLLVTLGLLAS